MSETLACGARPEYRRHLQKTAGSGAMTSKQPTASPPPTKDERLAQALRDNLARRKALTRARKSRPAGEPAIGSGDDNGPPTE